MKILLTSHFFHPSVGGIEEVSYNLAHKFVQLGHEVTVVTRTRQTSGIEFPFTIVRRPGPVRLLRLVRECDVFFHNNISLKMAWPLMLVKKPWVVAHHTWIARMDGTISLRDQLKQWVCQFATNISISAAMSKHIRMPSVIIGNPYRNRVFKLDKASKRELDLVFLGRLVWDKGADLLLDALSILQKKGITPGLSIIGDGPERDALQKQCSRLGLDSQVRFLGTHTAEDLAGLLNAHKIIVIPSRWQEPFGLVALEGIACGCVAIGAECGGLPDAIGPGGILFPYGESQPLADAIETLLGNEVLQVQYRQAAPEHLSHYTSLEVARKYLDVLEKVAR